MSAAQSRRRFQRRRIRFRAGGQVHARLVGRPVPEQSSQRRAERQPHTLHPGRRKRSQFPWEQAWFETTLERVRAELGDERTEEAVSEGSAFPERTIDDALALST